MRAAASPIAGRILRFLSLAGARAKGFARLRAHFGGLLIALEAAAMSRHGGWVLMMGLWGGLVGCGAGGSDDPDASPIVIDARVRDGGRDAAADAGSDGATVIDGSTLGPNCGLDYATPTVPTGHACAGLTLAPGVGLDSYLPVADGDTIELYRGPQGGLMFLLGMRATGFDAQDVTLCTQESMAGGGALGSACWHGSMAPLASAGGHQCAGLQAQTDPPTWSMPDNILGHDVTVVLTLTDVLGCQVTAMRTVHVAPAIASPP
jgi:hypothetical protein